MRVRKVYEVEDARNVEDVVTAALLCGAERVEIEKVYTSGLSGVPRHDDEWRVKAEFEGDE